MCPKLVCTLSADRANADGSLRKAIKPSLLSPYWQCGCWVRQSPAGFSDSSKPMGDHQVNAARSSPTGLLESKKPVGVHQTVWSERPVLMVPRRFTRIVETCGWLTGRQFEYTVNDTLEVFRHHHRVRLDLRITVILNLFRLSEINWFGFKSI